MVWTLALSTYLNDAPWEQGITKSELIDMQSAQVLHLQ